MTTWRKPFARRRSRWVRDRSLALTAAALLEFWSLPRISKDCASFSDGVDMRVVFRLAYCVVFALAHYVVHVLAYYVELKLAFSADDRRASTALLYQSAEKTAQIAGRQRLPRSEVAVSILRRCAPGSPFPHSFVSSTPSCAQLRHVGAAKTSPSPMSLRPFAPRTTTGCRPPETDFLDTAAECFRADLIEGERFLFLLPQSPWVGVGGRSQGRSPCENQRL